MVERFAEILTLIQNGQPAVARLKRFETELFE